MLKRRRKCFWIFSFCVFCIFVLFLHPASVVCVEEEEEEVFETRDPPVVCGKYIKRISVFSVFYIFYVGIFIFVKRIFVF